MGSLLLVATDASEKDKEKLSMINHHFLAKCESEVFLEACEAAVAF